MEFDTLDRHITQALHFNGRAPFTRIAETLDVSDQTVARRYARLRSAGVLQVIGMTWPAALGETHWAVRVGCVPGAAGDLAEALARREDTKWVSLVSGGTEIVLSVLVGSGGSLLDRLPHSRHVTGVTAHCHLHTFFGGPQSLVGKLGTLTPEQIERLRTPEPGPPAAPVSGITEQDRRLLAVLRRDGRAPVPELAAATGWTPATVRRRLAELRANGTLYFDLESDFRLFGLAARVCVWLTVSPARLAETGAALAAHPEVAFCAAITGESNLFASVNCADVASLYRYVTTRIAALPAVERMEISPSLRVVKGIAPRGPASRSPQDWR
ncbi:Lrp/AsnC family transcriptional regulator [Streptomyces millisiae]|uniref:Lrp/AsnC family transcriptional regulator n=1 Tax=Streptomyces millisiae TaxID=3075542 RepID=A0ABU2M156_9ACTN|nr:Lrp/AsnC family transcriptional regulator [Streptomyces sp. DSM 44918]MDT0323582.1 Lrp/AsnC family transcriptional regulator [Streptomyces sp. DSM 44918]